MIKVNCDKCKRELTEPGALLFSPPDIQGWVQKQHICRHCYQQVNAGVENNQRQLALSSAITRHRNAEGHDRCWENDVALYIELSKISARDGTQPSIPDPKMPSPCELKDGCDRYIAGYKIDDLIILSEVKFLCERYRAGYEKKL